MSEREGVEDVDAGEMQAGFAKGQTSLVENRGTACPTRA